MADNLSYKLTLHACHHFQCSNRSSTAAATTAAQAKAEASKACRVFIDGELKIKMELLKLLLQKKTAAAIAEAEILEAVADELNE